MISATKTRVHVLAGVTLSMMLFFSAGCSMGSPIVDASTPEPTESTTFLLRGSVTVPIDFDRLRALGIEDPEVGSYCPAAPGYTDVADGSQVTISDEDDTTIATGRVSSGGGDVWVAGGAMTAKYCRFSFDIYNVPTDANFYAIHIGNTYRGEVQYTLKQAMQGVELYLE